MSNYKVRTAFAGASNASTVISIAVSVSGTSGVNIRWKKINVVEVEYKDVAFILWDVGGTFIPKSLWIDYYVYTQAVIFVVNASDKERTELVR